MARVRGRVRGTGRGGAGPPFLVDDLHLAPKGETLKHTLALYGGQMRGGDLATARGTAWGLLNAVTEHVDHAAGKERDGRLRSAWFGRGEWMNRKVRER